MEENEIVNPFYGGFNFMELQQSDGYVHYIALDATHCGQTLYCNVLNINTTFLEDT